MYSCQLFYFGQGHARMVNVAVAAREMDKDRFPKSGVELRRPTTHPVMGSIHAISVGTGKARSQGGPVVTASTSRFLLNAMSVRPRQKVISRPLRERCGSNLRGSGSGYGFQIPLTMDVLSAYGGEPLYIDGVSSVGVSNNVLGNVGHFRNPRAGHD